MACYWPDNIAQWRLAPALIDTAALPGVGDAGALLAPAGAPALPAADNDRRLGRLFERHVQDWITRTPALTLRAHNVAIHDGTRTLGELDLLVSHGNTLMHWEVTLKFYLGVDETFWPGPDPRDQFARRLHRLRTHQFPLLARPATGARLAALGLSTPHSQHLLSRGMLFYPHDRLLAPPAGAHPDHLRGTWWPLSAVPREGRFLPIPKSHWLDIKMLSNNSQNWLASPRLIDYVHAQDRPVMVLYESQAHAYLPGVVVSDGWLDVVSRRA